MSPITHAGSIPCLLCGRRLRSELGLRFHREGKHPTAAEVEARRQREEDARQRDEERHAAWEERDRRLAAEAAEQKRRTIELEECARVLAEQWATRKLAIANGAPASKAELRRIHRDRVREERKAERAARKAARRAEWLASIEPELAAARVALEQLGAPNPGLRSAFVFERTACAILKTTTTRLRRLGLPTRPTKNPHYRSRPALLYAIVDLARAKREHADDLRKRQRARTLGATSTSEASLPATPPPSSEVSR